MVTCLAFFAAFSGAAEVPPVGDATFPQLSFRPDFSGAWEKDYRRSDNWERQVQAKLAELRRAAERRARGGRADIGVPGAQITLGGNRTNVIDLARFTETISRHNIMTIKQDEHEVRIEREGEADLVCTVDKKAVLSGNEFGSERCVWSANRLIFKISLNEGTEILHHFRISADRQSINMQTRVSHRGSSFELVQFFTRFGDSNNQYNCRQTISRGKVCSLLGEQAGGNQE
ncbi:hypothetical protein [Pseudoteredinibacter isoporae]|uniref:Uncharacterized protein n=1 Tax=Pseudoteredinibacter isoporae TaxID=570281 RepID=A0A7X0JXD3_9GAMM|nr:hypothetical protein [Pseudoteredinibacter isoporae]MBB6523433.1 hypothetical protein [Pseudoteredinibacter isoporae]NHO88944.1 hypothetical protein [Pseudoteredinibacter isoporae]NIB24348.1 hypothetical protein [Pseudoteredinibacter isoporae]